MKYFPCLKKCSSLLALALYVVVNSGANPTTFEFTTTTQVLL
jgi:hypothetical protein